jgi:hypothetical protein
MSGIAIARLSEERKAWRKEHPFVSIFWPSVWVDCLHNLLEIFNSLNRNEIPKN